MINLFSNMTAVLLLAAGAFLAAGMAFVCLRRQGCAGNKAAASVGIFALLAVPLCTYGAHALYCLADVPNLYRIGENPLLIFDLNYGGFALYGGMAGFFAACAIAAKVTKQRFLSLMDALAPAGLALIAFIRFAEGALGQGFSLDVENPAFCFFPLSTYDPEWDVWYLALFMLEGLYALLGAMYLQRNAAAGKRTGLALLLYAGMQIWFESLRRDNFMRCFGGFVRTMQLLSVVIVTALLIIRLARSGKGLPHKTLSLALHALCAGGVILMEFAVEYKVAFLLRLSMEVLTQQQHYAMCYGCMLLFVMIMLFNALLAQRRKA